jgi:hypothetical protein
MHPDDREHWAIIQSHQLRTEWLAKYMAGQLEHAGDLGAIPIRQLLREMRSEAYDQLSYIAEVERRIAETPDEIRALLLILDERKDLSKDEQLVVNKVKANLIGNGIV